MPAPSKVLAPEVADPSRTTSLSDKRSKGKNSYLRLQMYSLKVTMIIFLENSGGSTIVKEGNRFWHEQVDRVEESEAYRKLNAG